MRTSIKLSDLSSSIVAEMTEYTKRDLEKCQALKSDFKRFYPLEIWAEIEGDHIVYFFTRMVDYPQIQVNTLNYKNKIGIWDTTNFKTDQKYNGVEPNQIGVLSKKKIDDWVKYYQERATFLREVVRLKDEKIAAFKIEFEKAGGTLTTEEHGHGSQYGQILRGGLEYRVTINQPSGYIEQRIEKHYKTGNSIDTFLKMSDNKF